MLTDAGYDIKKWSDQRLSRELEIVRDELIDLRKKLIHPETRQMDFAVSRMIEIRVMLQNCMKDEQEARFQKRLEERRLSQMGKD